jgi:type IV pilus assembly protein PilE
MKSQNGFTLIELMITVAIVAILATVVYPSYLQYLTRNNRSAAESYMLTVANKEEQYALDVRQYFSVPTISAGCTQILTGVPLASIGITPPPNVSKNYNIDICANSAATPPTYVITATPIGNQLTADTQCGAISLRQDATKTPPTGCW